MELPPFIKDHPIFKHHEVKKVFPAIGLEDSSTAIDINPLLVLDADTHGVLWDAVIKTINNHKNNGKGKEKFKLHDLVPLQGYHIEFSSNINDISTISMRGLTSCVRWDGERKFTLVGSIVDPYCGVVYVRHSTQSNDYGSLMSYRSVVRLVELAGGGYGLFLEKTYAFNEAYVPYVRWLFRTFLSEKTSLPILEAPTDISALKIPLSEPVKELMQYDYLNQFNENKGWVSYRDSGLAYSAQVNCDWSQVAKTVEKVKR